jgi:DNA-binding XRE family transcriptional regulator
MDEKMFAEIRKRWGLNQADMAKLMEVSSALIVSQWENGYRNPSGIVKKIYRLLGELPPKEAAMLLGWLKSVSLGEKERRKITARRPQKK